MSNEIPETVMIYRELHSVLRRWIKEGDELTAFSVIGALEAVKADFMETLKRYNLNNEQRDDSK